MAFRNDINVDWLLRIITVEAPSVELTVQDLHDTIRVLEERPGEGLSYPVIISSEGKANLGGGQLVGITSTLQDAVVSFEARKVFSSSGTVTTGDVTGVSLVDASATFITDGVEPGAWVVNFTDQSVCSVMRVISETELLTDALGGGTDNQWGIGDAYKVQNVTQCEVSGGNLVAVDSVGAEQSSILPTAGTQIVRTSASSATLQELIAIQFSSYVGGVTIDTASSYSGTAYPVGTPRQPVNNLTDALDIATTLGLGIIYVKGNLTIPNQAITGIRFIGESHYLTEITINSAATITTCEFADCHLTGDLDGDCYLYDAHLENLTGIQGHAQSCVLEGNLRLGGVEAHFIDCAEGPSSLEGIPTLNMNGSGTSCIIKKYSGHIIITNKTGPEELNIDLNSGLVVLDSTVTAGTVVVRGVGRVVDNSTGTTTVDTSSLVNNETVANAVWESSNSGHVTTDTKGRAIALSVYGEAIHLSNNGAPGTVIGVNGTPANPVDNIADALTLLADTGFVELHILSGTHLLSGSLNEKQVTLIDEATLNFNGQNVNGTDFNGGVLKGTMLGVVHIVSSSVEDVSGLQGHLIEVGLNGNIALANGTTTFDRCHSHVAGLASPAIDMSAAGSIALFRGYSGGLQIEGMADVATICSIAFTVGELLIDSSCTGGTLVYRGIINPITDNSTGTTVVANDVTVTVWGTDVSAYSSLDTDAGGMLNFLQKIADSRMEQSPGNPGLLVLYDRDGITPLRTWQIKDATDGAVIASPGAPHKRGQGA